VDDCSSEVVHVGFVGEFLTVEVLSSVGLHVKLDWEFQVAVYLYFSHFVVVELKTFYGDAQDVW
jgi:hypothetical protein